MQVNISILRKLSEQIGNVLGVHFNSLRTEIKLEFPKQDHFCEPESLYPTIKIICSESVTVRIWNDGSGWEGGIVGYGYIEGLAEQLAETLKL